jgi:methylmalonyl-CoA mutase, N-terminal domain
VSVSTLSDLEKTLKGIPLDAASLSMTINATAGALVSMVYHLGDKAGIGCTRLSGTVQNDILKEFAARNAYLFPPEPSLVLCGDVTEFICKHMPRWNPISVSGYHMREAGATAPQEVGFAFANAIAYLEEAQRRGQKIDEVAPRITFFFAAHNGLFEEAAKFRAARRLWARLMRERFGAREARSCMLRFHVQTAGSTLTAAQPDNNVVRVALQALSAVLGGAQSLHTNAKDEALRLPSAGNAMLALRTQQIIAYESGVAEYVDPLAGSVAVEALTDTLEREIAACLQAVENLGGAVKAIRQGYMQREIRRAAYDAHREAQCGARTVVGVNRFADDARPALLYTGAAQRASGRTGTAADTERHRAAELSAARASRSEIDVRRALDTLCRDAEAGRNTMEATLETVACGGTIGEIYGALGSIFGAYREEGEAW